MKAERPDRWSYPSNDARTRILSPLPTLRDLAAQATSSRGRTDIPRSEPIPPSLLRFSVFPVDGAAGNVREEVLSAGMGPVMRIARFQTRSPWI